MELSIQAEHMFGGTAVLRREIPLPLPSSPGGGRPGGSPLQCRRGGAASSPGQNPVKTRRAIRHQHSAHPDPSDCDVPPGMLNVVTFGKLFCYNFSNDSAHLMHR